MKVFIKLLGTYRNLLPSEVNNYKFEVELPAGTTLANLMSRYEIPLTDDSVFLINGLSPDTLDQMLVDGDTVAAFSAMAGG